MKIILELYDSHYQEVCGGVVQVQASKFSQSRCLRWRNCRPCMLSNSTGLQVRTFLHEINVFF